VLVRAWPAASSPVFGYHSKRLPLYGLSGQRAVQQILILLATVAALTPLWWLTRPTEFPEKPENPLAPDVRRTGSEPAIDSRLNGAEPSFLSNIDTTRPECVEMKRELLERHAKGVADVFHIGDCDKRLRAVE
jgi:hypothetical protein